MNASKSLFNNGRRWLLILLVAACLAIPALANALFSDSPSTVSTEQMKLAGPKEGLGG